MKKIIAALSLTTSLASTVAQANICGTDYQTFNPTTNGLDFVTVQSSETLKPCFVNMGIFANYAANSLSYSRTTSNQQSGQQRQDRILGMDLSIGTGLTKRWDFGINVPMVISEHVDSVGNVSSFEKNGATEIKANSKYRFVGDESGGLAGVLSVNKNLIQDNPFAGSDPGLTWNFEAVADTVIAQRWAVAANFGYRKRNPGEPIANVPYVPMKDQWIYSLAGSYLVASLDTKLIAELYGSRAAQDINSASDRSMNSFEGLLGVKHDVSHNIAMHLGTTHRLDQAAGGAEWRIYAGLNWAIGPVCKDPISVERVSSNGSPDNLAELEILNINVELLFDFNTANIPAEKLEQLSSVLKPEFDTEFRNLSVEGHTDSVGRAEYNRLLSQRRAEFIAKYLIDKFKLDSKKVEAIGRGDTQPIADNGNYQGRQKNRRVELKIWRRIKH